MQLHFTKMHGAGNDFVVIDLISQDYKLCPQDVRRLADRHLGIGCDQVLTVEAPHNPQVDFRYRIYNADGNEVQQCGNGARCFALFVRDKKLTRKRIITVETAAGIIELRAHQNQQVEVDMGAPALEPNEIPFLAAVRQQSYALVIGGTELEIGAVSMGNPHAVIRVASIDHCEIDRLGPIIESHSEFPQQVNVSFMQIVATNEINLRVYERGVGETLACGTGACAAVVYGILRGWLSDSVTVALSGGKLSVSWAGEGQPVVMTGPAAVVFDGTIRI